MFTLDYNNSFYDSSACALYDNKLIAFIEEERLVRIRHAPGFGAKKSIKWCLEKSCLSECDFDYIIPRNEIDSPSNTNINTNKNDPKNLEDHHLYHAWSAWAQTTFSNASILVLDGHDGQNIYSGGIFDVNSNSIKCIRRFPSIVSLGSFYGYMAAQCGHGEFGEGKLMGLAPYGKCIEIEPLVLVDNEYGHILKNNTYYSDGEFLDRWISFLDPNALLTKEVFDFRYADIAATVQNTFETVVLDLCKYISANLPSKNLIFTGGCALNCTTTGKIIRSGLFDDVFVPPLCNDAGTILGSSLYVTKSKLKGPLVYNRVKYKLPETCKKVSKDYVYKLIKDDKVIALFEGGSEYGPRALCHRSLIANPDSIKMLYRINEIKSREYWRPLAPVVIADVFTDVFEIDKIWSPHRYMLATERIRDSWHNKIPAVVSVDKTARPQVLESGFFYEFMRDYDLPVLINTSLNSKGEAICETPEDAIKFVNNFNDVYLIFIQDNQFYIF